MKHTHLCLCFFIWVFVACKQNRGIQVYRLAKDAGSGEASQVPQVMPGGVVPPGFAQDPHAGLSAEQMSDMRATEGPRITDEAPLHWKKQAPTAMRQASYLIEGEGGASADVSLVILRGAAGGKLGNVNRWRGQLGLTEIDGAALERCTKKIATPVGEAVMVELEGLADGADAMKDGRMLGAIADYKGDGWFYKMRGNAALTAAAKDDFVRWVLSVKPVDGEPSGASPSGDGALTWNAPSTWKQAPAAASSMRYASFTISAADGGRGELVVSHFPGDVGGDLANVNRWRQQAGLPPVEQAGLSGMIATVNDGAHAMSVVDFKGAETNLLAAWTRHGGDTWFFKLTGPDALVSAEKTRFVDFLRSVRFNPPE